MLDFLEGHVEKLRKGASQLEEDRDALLSTLDSVVNADLMYLLDESEYYICNAIRSISGSGSNNLTSTNHVFINSLVILVMYKNIQNIFGIFLNK